MLETATRQTVHRQAAKRDHSCVQSKGLHCAQAPSGGARVRGSHHETYTPPKVISQTTEVERPVPVPVPVYEPPVVQYVPVPVDVTKPVFRPRPSRSYPRSLYKDHEPYRRRL